MMPDESDELLDYQTGQDEPEHVQQIDPVPVHLDGPVVNVPTVASHITCRTIVLDTNQPWDRLLPQDVLRIRARILPITNGVVICHSPAQAQDPANTTDQNFTAPNGALIPSSTAIVIEGTQQLFVATSKYPTRVSVIIERRGS